MLNIIRVYCYKPFIAYSNYHYLDISDLLNFDLINFETLSPSLIFILKTQLIFYWGYFWPLNLVCLLNHHKQLQKPKIKIYNYLISWVNLFLNCITNKLPMFVNNSSMFLHIFICSITTKIVKKHFLSYT